MSYERLVPGTKEWDLYYANHQSRYLFAVSQLRTYQCQKILDAATGVGYGAHLLAQNGFFVTAIDRDSTAVKLAKSKFDHEAVQFFTDDCQTFENCAPYAPFDAIVSFETLEHLPVPLLFLKNCTASLLPGQPLIISTPNKLVSSPQGDRSWEFHEKEYTPGDLIILLEDAGFTQIDIYGQQLTAVGILRQQLRAEFNKLNSNPFVRIGQWFQKTFRGSSFPNALPEQPEDFEIVRYPDTDIITQKGMKGPFVLIAVCRKK